MGNGETPKGEFIGYARVSTEDQNLRLQTDALKAAGCLNIYEEKISGSGKKSRPQLDLAIKDLRPGDTLLVWRIDRLARSGRELYSRLEQIEQAQAGFKSLQEGFDFSTSTGRFVLGILGLVAELERQMTIERTKAGMEALRARGFTLGRTIEFDAKKQARALKIAKAKNSVEGACKVVKVSKATFYGKFKVKRKAGKLIITRRKA
jgi:DNA invertase Pin-like site-specific DNA recombinase